MTAGSSWMTPWSTTCRSSAPRRPVSPIENVTIRRLMSHESGLMGDPPGTDWEGPTYQGR